MFDTYETHRFENSQCKQQSINLKYENLSFIHTSLNLTQKLGIRCYVYTNTIFTQGLLPEVIMETVGTALTHSVCLMIQKAYRMVFLCQ